MARCKKITCHECSGHGIVSDYGDGEDFYGPKECGCCDGAGRLLVTRAKRLMTLSGKFRGRL